MKAEITITINNHNYRATTTLDECLGDGEMHGSTRYSFDILTQTLPGMMSEVCNMVKKSEFKEEESEGKRSTRETEINLYGHGRNEDNKECCTRMGGSRNEQAKR